jgi:hypothetical protein
MKAGKLSTTLWARRREYENLGKPSRETEKFEPYSYSEEWFLNLRAHLKAGDLERIVGFNQKDYEHWLLKTRRQHNLTNLFFFALGSPSDRT